MIRIEKNKVIKMTELKRGVNAILYNCAPLASESLKTTEWLEVVDLNNKNRKWVFDNKNYGQHYDPKLIAALNQFDKVEGGQC